MSDPTDKDSKKKKDKKLNIPLIWKYLWPHVRAYKWSTLFIFGISAIAFILGGVVTPKVYQRIIDVIDLQQGIPGTLPEKLLQALILLLVVKITSHVIIRAVEYVLIYSESKIIERMYNETLGRLTLHSQKFFSNNFSGSLVAKTKRYVRSIEHLYEIILWNFWSVSIQLVGVFIVVFSESTLLGTIFLLWSIIYIAFTLIFVKSKVKLDLKKAEMDSKVTSTFSDLMGNMLTVKVFSGHAFEKKSFSEVTHAEEIARRRSWNFSVLRNAVMGFFAIAIELAGIAVVLVLWAKGTVSAGVVVLIQLYTSNLSQNLSWLARAIVGFTESLTDVKEMVDIFEQTPDILDPEKPEKSRITEGAITFNNINFKYSDGQAVFKKFNLTIPAGQKVGLVGHSGSGKSTIMNLLLRFVDVDKGAITIDGQDIRNLTQDDLRSHISYVPQDPILFHRTIEENITYGNHTAKKAAVIEATKKARAHDFVMELPQKYKTLVGERGVKLSGGQRQRIAIARVMLESTPILILDEATSSLDSISEHHIQEAFIEAMKNRTTLVIAHRLSTVAHLDRIIVLDKGVIVEDGTHEELLKKGGMYTELWQHQTQSV